MKVFTFHGENPAEALKNAQRECGDEAMVINTKEIKKKTAFQPGLFEITVALEDKDLKTYEEKKRKPLLPKGSDEVLFQLSEAAKQIDKITNVTANSSKNFLHNKQEVEQSSHNASKIALDFKVDKKELEEIKNIQKNIFDRVKLIQNMVWDGSSDLRDGLVIPPEFAEIYRITKNSGMANEHLSSIMKLTLEHMPPKMRQNSETIKRYFGVLIRKMAPTRPEFTLQKPSKKIIMLVGPTGVGKTTTLAKLAARFAYKSKLKYKVGIITLDTYRIGAVEQLMYYAKMMKLGIETVQDPIDFPTSINTLKHCDYILVDTAGCSQHDKKKIQRTQEFLNSEHHTSIDATLVVSANTKLADLREIYQNYSELNIDSIIATKFDETSGFGNLFSLVYETKKPLSYYSIGQEVPEDLLVANGDFLVDCLLDGFKRSNG